MTLKERLDAVWNDNRIACPCHVVIWSERRTGCLFYRKGKLLGPRKKRVKGKGWTFLMKDYGLVWVNREREMKE